MNPVATVVKETTFTMEESDDVVSNESLNIKSFMGRMIFRKGNMNWYKCGIKGLKQLVHLATDLLHQNQQLPSTTLSTEMRQTQTTTLSPLGLWQRQIEDLERYLSQSSNNDEGITMISSGLLLSCDDHQRQESCDSDQISTRHRYHTLYTMMGSWFMLAVAVTMIVQTRTWQTHAFVSPRMAAPCWTITTIQYKGSDDGPSVREIIWDVKQDCIHITHQSWKLSF